MGIISKKWNKRIMPDRLTIGKRKGGWWIPVHWTEEIIDGQKVCVGRTK